MEVSVYRAEPTTWLDVITGLSPILGAVLAIGGVIASIIYANQRERDRQRHERLLKDAELEAQKEARFRDERIAAYRKLLAATTTAHVEQEGVDAISAAYAEISMLASTDEISRAAATVWVTYGNTQRISDKSDRHPETPVSEFAQALDKARTARKEFLVLAWEELGVKGRSAGLEDLEASSPGDALPGLEAPQERLGGPETGSAPSEPHPAGAGAQEGQEHDSANLKAWTSDVEARLRPDTPDAQEATSRPWWRRMFRA